MNAIDCMHWEKVEETCGIQTNITDWKGGVFDESREKDRATKPILIGVFMHGTLHHTRYDGRPFWYDKPDRHLLALLVLDIEPPSS